MSARPSPERRSAFGHFTPITTRWKDNDAYRHINNASYYAFFDTALNAFLIAGGFLDIENGTVTGLIAHSECDYFSPLSFPDRIDVGLAIGTLGTSSVAYRLAVFREGEDCAAAQGKMVHVYVDRHTGRPVPLPQEMRRHLAGLEKAQP